MLFIDLETFSTLGIKEVSAYRYARSAELLLVGYAIDDGPVQVWDVTTTAEPPADFVAAWSSREPRCAHGSAFERLVLDATFGKSEPRDWHDTSVLALTCGLPGSLAKVGEVLGYAGDEAKDKNGYRLINTFCMPAPKNHKVRRYTREHKPDEWARFIDYCRRDVEVCRRLWRELPHWVYDHERENWLLDQCINDRGVAIDEDFARAAVQAAARATRAANEELITLTGGAVTAVSELLSLREWLGRQGVEVESLDKAAIVELLDQQLPPDARRALQLRQSAGRSSVAKYEAALAYSLDGRLCGSLQFYGANRTGRWAGRQLQPQNMPRPALHGEALDQAREAIQRGLVSELFDDPLGALSDCVRGVLAAAPGHRFLVADLSNIEGRMLAWLAGEQWKLDAFQAYDEKRGPDLYRLTYARSFGKPVDAVTDDERQVGKVEELALGFGGSLGAFNSMAADYGVRLEDEAVIDVVQKWRMAHPKTTGLWRAVGDAAIAAVCNPGTTYKVRDLRFRAQAHGRWSWLLVRLPSGRLLCYFEPKLTEQARGGFQLSYIGQLIGANWGRVTTWGGKVAENITQAAARDVFMAGVRAAASEGFPVVLSVHDEVVSEAHLDTELDVAGLCACLTRPLSWCPGLPLAAKGYESTYYRKD